MSTTGARAEPTEKGLRVLNLTTSYIRRRGDFSAVFVHWMNKELAKCGVAVEVVAPSEKGLPRREQVDGVTIHRFPYFVPEGLQRLAYGDGMPTNLKRSSLARLQVLPFVASMLGRGLGLARSADIIHCHWAHTVLVGLPLARLFHKPLVLTVWGSDIRSSNPTALRFFARGSDRIISPALETHVNLRRVGVERFEYIPAMIDPEKFGPEVDTEDIRKKMALGGEKVVLFVGRLYPEKDPATFVRSIPNVLRERRDVKFVVAGDGMLMPELHRLRRELRIEAHLHLVGASTEVEKYLQLADCLVACANPITNVWSSTIAEAMTVGVPVLVTNTTPIDEEFYTDGIDCLYIRPGDPEDLAAKLLCLLRSPALAHRLCAGATTLLRREGRTPDQITANMLRLYQGLL